MLNNLTLATPNQDRIYIIASGSCRVIEDLYREDMTLAYSSPAVTFSGVVYSGVITQLLYSLYDGDLQADHIIEFSACVSGLDTLDVAGTTYTFTQVMSGVNNIPIKTTPLTQAIATYRVINCIGTPGTDYYTGQTPHPLVSGLLADNPLYIEARISGMLTDNYQLSTTSSAIILRGAYFTKARSAVDTVPMYNGSVTCSGNGTYYLCPVTYSDLGTRLYYELDFATYSGMTALNASRGVATYSGFTVPFTGRNYLPYYAEVSGLSVSNSVGGKISSDGYVELSWTSPTMISGMYAPLAYPLTTGTPTQQYRHYSFMELGQRFSNVVFVFRSSGAAPQRNWPRPTDANGTWYYAGRTNYNHVTLTLEPGYTYSIWVGFGNRETLLTSGLPFGSTLSSIYIGHYGNGSYTKY
jgi:hypothetical protein